MSVARWLRGLSCGDLFHKPIVDLGRNATGRLVERRGQLTSRVQEERVSNREKRLDHRLHHFMERGQPHKVVRSQQRLTFGCSVLPKSFDFCYCMRDRRSDAFRQCIKCGDEAIEHGAVCTKRKSHSSVVMKVILIAFKQNLGGADETRLSVDGCIRDVAEGLRLGSPHGFRVQDWQKTKHQRYDGSEQGRCCRYPVGCCVGAQGLLNCRYSEAQSAGSEAKSEQSCTQDKAATEDILSCYSHNHLPRKRAPSRSPIRGMLTRKAW